MSARHYGSPKTATVRGESVNQALLCTIVKEAAREAVCEALTELRNPEDRLLSADDLAAWLNVSRRKIDEMQAADELPQPIRIGRQRRWRRKEIDSWLDTLPNPK